MRSWFLETYIDFARPRRTGMKDFFLRRLLLFGETCLKLNANLFIRWLREIIHDWGCDSVPNRKLDLVRIWIIATVAPGRLDLYSL